MELPLGYRFAGLYTGVKKNPTKKDLALVVSDSDASAAGVFTTNRVCAAPVQVCRSRLPSARVRAILINSGNANACTGPQGVRDAEEMTAAVAGHLAASPEQVLVCSTGVIGRPLPMDKLRAGIDQIVGTVKAGQEAFELAASGIMTTDTRIKVSFRSLNTKGNSIRIAGFAKGAAMIGPNMATMLAFVMTDAVASPSELDAMLRPAVDQSFHSISVEGHTSTNDSVIVLANGQSGVSIDGVREDFSRALAEVCQDLAIAIIDDAEEVTHRMTIDVTGARSDAEARQIAKTVADSALVKTAIYGNDPNWGRICSAAGYAGIPFNESEMSLTVNGTLLYDKGAPTAFDSRVESERMKASFEVKIELLLTLGDGRCRFWSSDLSLGYVKFNAEYTT